MTRGNYEHQPSYSLEILDGPCCESRDCRSRELWPYDDETQEEFLARLRFGYGGLTVGETPA